MKQISAAELNNWLQTKETQSNPLLLDVREPSEHAICQIDNSMLIPMNQIPEKMATLNKQQEIVVICHHGMRSMQVAQYLQQNGFKNITNLQGGIEQWRQLVEPSMRAY